MFLNSRKELFLWAFVLWSVHRQQRIDFLWFRGGRLRIFRNGIGSHISEFERFSDVLFWELTPLSCVHKTSQHFNSRNLSTDLALKTDWKESSFVTSWATDVPERVLIGKNIFFLTPSITECHRLRKLHSDVYPLRKTEDMTCESENLQIHLYTPDVMVSQYDWIPNQKILIFQRALRWN